MNRAWTFIIDKELNEQQLSAIKQEGEKFVKSWTAHENQLSGDFEIFKNRIIIIKVNEEENAASGCSIDKLTRFIKQLESDFSIQLMNRLLVAYKQKEKIEVVHSSKIKELLKNELITADTVVFNTSLANQEELSQWEKPLNQTWLNKYL
ncbi:MAG: hypothetical protein JWO32_1873 [Bacteroidetes bacterium]|nr:hypothetical protein [Bacteroidota bacterium]